ncbi:MAG TPA: hypothetical protein VNN13_07390 [Methylomirabilota bacterium]|nr:hypothetical protein [Methylomirabilota bacterium]
MSAPAFRGKFGGHVLTFRRRPDVCSLCSQLTNGRQVTVMLNIDGKRERLIFCRPCVGADHLTDERYAELWRRMLGFPDALERWEEEKRIAHFIDAIAGVPGKPENCG